MGTLLYAIPGLLILLVQLQFGPGLNLATIKFHGALVLSANSKESWQLEVFQLKDLYKPANLNASIISTRRQEIRSKTSGQSHLILENPRPS